MPNWCHNILTLRHENPAMLEKARDAFNEGALIAAFIPEPDYTKTTVLSDFPDIAPGPVGPADAWRHWRARHWGTRCDVGREDGMPAAEINGAQLYLEFDSAWSPPTGLFLKLAESGFAVCAYYIETGAGVCGFFSNATGDTCHDLPEDPARCAEVIPGHVVEALNLPGDWYP